MARYLVYTSPARGHLYPIVPTLLELGRRGHDVHIRTLSSELPTLRDLGFRASPVASAIEALPLQDWKGTTPEEGLAAGLRTFAARATHEMPDLECALEEVDPDILLVDVMTPGAAAVAEAASMPWAQWIPFFQHIFPFTLIPSGMDVLNVAREQVGLSAVEPRDVWRAPLYLYFTAPPFLPTAFPLPPSFLPVGPGSWEPPWPAPQWIDELDVPLVLVVISSEFQRDDLLVEPALEALASEDIELVITTAAHDPERFQVRGRATIVRWLPHSTLLSMAACVVCHGGMGITQKALSAGVPLCVVPFGRDQFEVAQQVERVRAGTWISVRELAPDSLHAAVRRAMSKRDGAQAVATQFGRAGGANAAADALESLQFRARSGAQISEGLTARLS